MRHQIRWTAISIAQRLALVEGLAHRRRQPLPPFQFTPLEGPISVAHPPPTTPRKMGEANITPPGRESEGGGGVQGF